MNTGVVFRYLRQNQNKLSRVLNKCSWQLAKFLPGINKNLVLFEWQCAVEKQVQKNVLNCSWILERLRDMNLSAMAFDDLYLQGHPWQLVIK